MLFSEEGGGMMQEEACILCGQRFPTGLQVMGCLICFPCEKRLMNGLISPESRRRLCALYERKEKTAEVKVCLPLPAVSVLSRNDTAL